MTYEAIAKEFNVSKTTVKYHLDKRVFEKWKSFYRIVYRDNNNKTVIDMLDFLKNRTGGGLLNSSSEPRSIDGGDIRIIGDMRSGKTTKEVIISEI